ncbi:MAG: biotin--[acetyl-CoA-carboxylase] ligase [Clostridia bacterium]|nr:biotin--[acetyl-CoA-carboxylase] ligase [Clostridia bacterium]
MKIINFDRIDSTNEFLKTYEPHGDVIAVAKMQTGGKGTKGRSFVSASGGLYLSVRREYRDYPARDAFKIMVNACVAVCRTVEYFGAKPVIRWANDVLCGGKKICGTLIENTLSNGHIARSIVGIGLNVTNELPDELKPIATNLYEQTGRAEEVLKVEQVLINNLEKTFTIKDYKSYINWFGQDITLKFADSEVAAVAADVDAEGRLICNINGKTTAVSSAEVSLRF